MRDYVLSTRCHMPFAFNLSSLSLRAISRLLMLRQQRHLAATSWLMEAFVHRRSFVTAVCLRNSGNGRPLWVYPRTRSARACAKQKSARPAFTRCFWTVTAFCTPHFILINMRMADGKMVVIQTLIKLIKESIALDDNWYFYNKEVWYLIELALLFIIVDAKTKSLEDLCFALVDLSNFGYKMVHDSPVVHHFCIF